MANDDVFRTVAGDFETEIEEKRSRFIAAVRRVSTAAEAEEFVRARKKANPAARHTVYAYVLRDGSVRYTDDGEPQGTAGLPTLELIRHAGLADVCVATTRYFGGILLGTGGLTRAYAGAAKAALEGAGVAAFIRFTRLSVSLSYTDYQKLIQELPRFDGREETCDFAETVTLVCRVPATEAEAFAARVTDLTAGRSMSTMLGDVQDTAP